MRDKETAVSTPSRDASLSSLFQFTHASSGGCTNSDRKSSLSLPKTLVLVLEVISPTLSYLRKTSTQAFPLLSSSHRGNPLRFPDGVQIRRLGSSG